MDGSAKPHRIGRTSSSRSSSPRPSNAVKTRERLFADLKEELELLASLQEEHLFPVLRRHGMHDLLREAITDNEETAALLAELERMPKNSAEFISQVSELRRVFQQHIRDDRKELLPAVLQVLSDEEANAIVETVEDEMANIDEMKRADSRQAREQGEAVQRVTEDVADTLRAGVEERPDHGPSDAGGGPDQLRRIFGADPPLDRPGLADGGSFRRCCLGPERGGGAQPAGCGPVRHGPGAWSAGRSRARWPTSARSVCNATSTACRPSPAVAR